MFLHWDRLLTPQPEPCREQGYGIAKHSAVSERNRARDWARDCQVNCDHHGSRQNAQCLAQRIGSESPACPAVTAFLDSSIVGGISDTMPSRGGARYFVFVIRNRKETGHVV